mmetsp:Transcript_2742/g.8179  ORF Transcript_2742/g.8179 Transcript_2742/m.8179 type:complete len:825 (+) Transcript_2742:139-2613(+)
MRAGRLLLPSVRVVPLLCANCLARISLPVREKRVFMDNSTQPRPVRSGFNFPRFDSRLHDGDEVQLETVHQSWLSVTVDPSVMFQGRHLVLKASSGKYCGTLPGHVQGRFYCNFSEAPLTGWLKFVQARRLNPKATGTSSIRILHMGSWCVDWPDGWRCNSSNHEEFEMFRVVRAGDGMLALQGPRSGSFCADEGPHGVVCNRRERDNSTAFEAVTDTPLKFGVVHSMDRHAAATFVVHRKSLDSQELALFCKDQGYFLAADGPRGEVSCSSSEPWTFWSARVDWWDMTSFTLQSPLTRQYLEAPDFTLDVKIRTDNPKGSGWALWKVVLLGGYEHERPIIRGVNLGNWFLLEKWMAPKLFHNASSDEPFEGACTAMDEHGLMDALGPTEGRRRMEQHWATWITEDDIIWLAKHGINAVRVPFGYWMAYPSPPFVFGQMKYLKLLFQWCERHGLTIFLDFHGLKGSQTANPTSGNCGACGRSQCGTTHIRFLEEQRTNLLVIDKLTSEFSRSPAYLGFTVANEVASTADSKETMAFYQQAYNIIRRKNEDALIVFFATFNPSTYPFTNFRNVAQDVHIYFGMGFGGPPTVDQQHNLGKAQRAVSGFHWPVLVGEWSLGGSGHPKLPPGPAQMEHFLVRFARMQLQAYETHCLGWFYWSYKTMYPNSTWNFRDMCKAGWLPECKNEGLNYGTAEWWNTSSCSYNYLEGGCGHREPRPSQPAWLWLPIPLLLSAAGAVVLLATLRPPWALRCLASARAAAAVASEVGTSASIAATGLAKAWWLPRLQGWERMCDDDGVDGAGRLGADRRSSEVLMRKEPAEQPFIW